MDSDTVNYTLPVNPAWSNNRVDLNGAEIYYFPGFLAGAEAKGLFSRFLSELRWQTRTIKLFGKEMKQPRQIAFYGDEGTGYRYSGQTWQGVEWPVQMRELRDRLTAFTTLRLNCCLANLYRTGNDSMGWHADNEKDLSIGIASLTLGHSRDFLIKNRANEKLKIGLGNGDLLLMLGETQLNCKHALPKVREQTGPRINLTFRYNRYKPMSKR